MISSRCIFIISYSYSSTVSISMSPILIWVLFELFYFIYWVFVSIYFVVFSVFTANCYVHFLYTSLFLFVYCLNRFSLILSYSLDDILYFRWFLINVYSQLTSKILPWFPYIPLLTPLYVNIFFDISLSMHYLSSLSGCYVVIISSIGLCVSPSFEITIVFFYFLLT